MKQAELIEELIEISKRLNQEAERIKGFEEDLLLKRPQEGAWNALECFKHLNLYIDIYNDFFKQALQKAPAIQSNREIKRGYWGNRFINWMEPKEKGMTKMNTFKSKNPIGLSLDKGVITHFIQANEQTIAYLKKAQGKDIQKAKCNLALPLLKIKLSDAFNFLITHNRRHMKQIQRAIA